MTLKKTYIQVRIGENKGCISGQEDRNSVICMHLLLYRDMAAFASTFYACIVFNNMAIDGIHALQVSLNMVKKTGICRLGW